MNPPVQDAPPDTPVVRREDLEPPPELAGARVRRRLLLIVVIVVGVVAVITLVPGLASLRSRLEHGDPTWLAIGAVLKVLSGVCFAVAFRSVFCRRMSWGTSFEIGFSELGANAVLPIGGAGGLALGAWALRRGGMDSARIARRSVAFFFLTSVPNVLGVILLGAAFAIGLISGRSSVVFTAGPAALALLAVAATILAGRLARVAERRATARRGTGSRIAAGFRALSEGVDDALDLLRHGGPLLLLGLIGYLGFDVMIMWATFHAFGNVPSLGIIWFGYLLGELGGLIPLPGGIGGVDLGLVGAYTLYNVPVGAATAAVLGYRAIALVVPVVLGSVAFIKLRRSVARESLEVARCVPGQQVEIVGVGEAQLSG